MNLNEVHESEIRHEIDCRIPSPIQPLSLSRRLIHCHQSAAPLLALATEEEEEILNFVPGEFSTSFISERAPRLH